jgi:hypothetical protein
MANDVNASESEVGQSELLLVSQPLLSATTTGRASQIPQQRLDYAQFEPAAGSAELILFQAKIDWPGRVAKKKPRHALRGFSRFPYGRVQGTCGGQGGTRPANASQLGAESALASPPTPCQCRRDYLLKGLAGLTLGLLQPPYHRLGAF